MKTLYAISFTPGLWPSLATAVLLPSLLALGFWQLDRAEQKRQILAEFAAGGLQAESLATGAGQLPARYQRVRIAGRYDPQRQFLLDAMPGSQGAGFHVLNIFHPDDGGLDLLVNRGWIPEVPDRTQLPSPAIPKGARVLSGRLDRLPRPGLELGDGQAASSDWPRLVLFPTIHELEEIAGNELYPMVMLLDASAQDGFERIWRPVNLSPDKHIAYAVQWFALAGAVLVIFVALNIRRRAAA